MLKRRSTIYLLIVAIALSGCGKKDKESKTDETVNAVTVSAEVSESEIDDEYASNNSSLPIEVDESLANEMVILENALFLYSAGTDEGYYPGDYIDWFLNAEPTDGIAIIYACDDPEHGGWGVLGIGCNVKGVGRVQYDINAYAYEPERERMLYLTMQELAELMGTEDIKNLETIDIGAWNGGRIAGLYYLDSTTASQMKEYLDNKDAANQIQHTYEGKLSNANAIGSATELYELIKSIPENQCLTGQMESTWMGSADYEMDYIHENTGKLPVIRGFDFMHNNFDDVTNRAIDWYNKGGIVTICWHTGSNFATGYDESVADNIDWDEAFVEGSDTYNKLIDGMDRAVPYLKTLQDAGVPVLWRPFHELDGGWFWWSKGGGENFIKLWQMMYNHYTNDCGLNNLIWVCAYSGNGMDVEDWYPGDEYIDIIGADSYNPGANGELYRTIKDIAPDGMPIAYHECSNIPTEEEMIEADAHWVYFMTWHTEYLTDENNNTKDNLNKIYNSDYYITLDEIE